MLALAIMPSALIAIFLIIATWCSMAWVAFRCSNSKIVIIAYRFSFTWIPITVIATWCSTAWVASCCSNSKIVIIAYVLQGCSNT
ncbi:hypothetical protein NC651_036750 [Populus alba x Populus x berolinensis]|nr:hypothetical protein NC651_036750 [Populus alba x Populus x berolinensis]